MQMSLPKTPGDTAKLAADVKAGEEPFVKNITDELAKALRTRYPQLRSMSMLSANGECLLLIRVECNFLSHQRKAKVTHHVVVPGEILTESVQVDVRPVQPKVLVSA